MLHQYERAVMLQSIDTHWREHLAALDYLRQGIHLRGYAQKQPKQEYKREAFELFGAMLDSIKREVTQHLMAVQIRSQEQVEEAERRAEEAAQAAEERAVPPRRLRRGAGAGAGGRRRGRPRRRAPRPSRRRSRSSAPAQKVGRNDPCPCGSGKKYKQLPRQARLRPPG